MITFTLEMPDAMESLSLVQLASGRCLELAGRAVRDGNATTAKIYSERAERLTQIASAMQRAMILQRGLDRTANEG